MRARLVGWRGGWRLRFGVVARGSGGEGTFGRVVTF